MDAGKFYNLCKIHLPAFLILFLSGGAAAQSGGQYAVEQSVIASGGAANSGGGQYSLAGTIGQTVAGQRATTAPYSVHAGFWNAAWLPTAAIVSVGGRVTTNDGLGIRSALVMLTDANGATRTVLTGKFGAFVFREIEAGQTVIVSVGARRFTFAEPTRIVFVVEDANEINFVAAPGEPTIEMN